MEDAPIDDVEGEKNNDKVDNVAAAAASELDISLE